MASSRIARRFAARAAEGRSALIPYITAGFPEADTTAALLPALARAGADVIEIGVPFSDPLADGPTIQASSHRALTHGTTVRRVLDFVRDFRREHDTPLVLFTYLNPALSHGFEDFCRDAAAAGADGLLLTDLPAGADPDLEAVVRGAGLDIIRLLAPTTADDRIARVAEGGGGFLYYISRTGVTGTRAELPPGLADEVARIRERVTLPVAVGFGISTPEQAAAVAHLADGVIVGSALIQRLEAEGVAGAEAFLASLRRAMDAAAE